MVAVHLRRHLTAEPAEEAKGSMHITVVIVAGILIRQAVEPEPERGLPRQKTGDHLQIGAEVELYIREACSTSVSILLDSTSFFETIILQSIFIHYRIQYSSYHSCLLCLLNLYTVRYNYINMVVVEVKYRYTVYITYRNRSVYLLTVDNLPFEIVFGI